MPAVDESKPASTTSSDSNILRLSQCSTPDVLSLNDEEDRESDGAAVTPKAWKDLIVRRTKDPEVQPFHGPLDTYLTKTSIRAIAFSQHKVRWKRIVDADLYC